MSLVEELSKISQKAFKHWERQYYLTGVNTTQRFGQNFINEFMPHVSDPEIFYEENTLKAKARILQKYILKGGSI